MPSIRRCSLIVPLFIFFLHSPAQQKPITDNDWKMVQLKKTMIESSKMLICLAIAEKVNTIQPIRICGIDKKNMLITELHADDPFAQAYMLPCLKIL